MPNCDRSCGDCKHCVAAHAQLVIDEKDAENAKLKLQVSEDKKLLDAAREAWEEERRRLNRLVDEVTAHRDRLRDMLNDIRGLLLCPPADLECQIMRRIEDGTTIEKRKCEHKTVPTFDGLGVRYKCQLCGEYISEY